MPNGILPAGWRAVLLGSGRSVEDLTAFVPLEEGMPEGSLLLLEFQLAEYPSAELIGDLNTALAEAGVTPWPGASYYAIPDPDVPELYIAWQKGIAWLPIIIGIMFAAPFIMWMILPESVKTFIGDMITLVVMLVMFYFMSKFMKPLAEPERPREVREAAR